MERQHCYALLSAVGMYEEPGKEPLPACAGDLRMMRRALTEGLRFPAEQIRVLGEGGRLTVREYARALQEFSSVLTSDDLLLVYCSGHGNGEKLAFTDESLSLASLAGFLRRLPARNRILILDCCESGGLRIPGQAEMKPGEALSELAERGTALLASAAAGERAWMDTGALCSVFTEAVCMAMLSRTGLREGKRTLFSVMEYARDLMRAWNNGHPEHAQTPVFRADLIGTAVFDAADFRPYRKTEVRLETEHYVLCDVRSVSTVSMRRLAAFFLCGEELTVENIAEYTREAARTLRYCGAAGSAKEEARFRGTPARAVWCFFGRDLRDMREGCYAGSGLWTADEEARRQLVRDTDGGITCGGVRVRMNRGYEPARRMRETPADRDAYVREMRNCLSHLVSGAERIIGGLHQLENGETGADGLRRALEERRGEIGELYVRLSDAPVPDEELRAWDDAVHALAERVFDLALPLSRDSVFDDRTAVRLMQHAAERYYEAVGLVRQAEKKCRIYGDL